MCMYVQLSLNSHESGGHVIRSLIVMFKSLKKKRWKIPNLGGHDLRPPDLFVCSCKTEKVNSLCLYNFIAFCVGHEEEKQHSPAS